MIRRLTAPALLSLLAVAAAAEEPAEKSEEKGMLRHVVLFKFKEDVTEEQVREVERAFAALPKKIDAIAGLEWGTDVSVENRAEGFTHCFIVSFRDAKGRDAYLPHDAHQEFIKLALPRIDKVLVIDFVAGK